MKKILWCFVLLISLILPKLIFADSIPKVNATAAVLMDAETGKILYSKNSDTVMAPASTTKIMTAVLAIEKGKLNQTIRVSRAAAAKGGSSMYLASSEHQILRNLLYGLMLASGNDAATAIAEAIAGSESKFALMMTNKAHTLGMNHTNFKNPSGLPAANHYTTAHDMALLARYALKNKLFAEIVHTKVASVPGPAPGKTRNLINHNKLLWRYPYTTGIKTGYTMNAGRCLVASARQKERTLIAVVLKSGTIYDDSRKLFDYGYHLH